MVENEEHDEWVEAHVGRIRVGCKSGKHRSTICATEGAKFLRTLGFTVEVIFLHYHEGATDVDQLSYQFGSKNDVPCGCQFDPHYCLAIQRIGGWRGDELRRTWPITVSYTHLTLPTKRIV